MKRTSWMVALLAATTAIGEGGNESKELAVERELNRIASPITRFSTKVFPNGVMSAPKDSPRHRLSPGKQWEAKTENEKAGWVEGFLSASILWGRFVRAELLTLFPPDYDETGDLLIEALVLNHGNQKPNDAVNKCLPFSRGYEKSAMRVYCYRNGFRDSLGKQTTAGQRVGTYVLEMNVFYQGETNEDVPWVTAFLKCWDHVDTPRGKSAEQIRLETAAEEEADEKAESGEGEE